MSVVSSPIKTSNQAQQQEQQQQQQHHVCKGCSCSFPSRSAVFRHLKETDAICLSETDRIEYFIHMSKNQKREKVIILYGYWIPPIYEYPFKLNCDNKSNDDDDVIRNGEDVADLILEVLECRHSDNITDAHRNDNNKSFENEKVTSSLKANRSYGHLRSSIIAQEDGTSAITEVLATKLIPLVGTKDTDAVSVWIQNVNDALTAKLQSMSSKAEIRILGRQVMPMNRFNAEMDISHRRVEYLLPAEFVLPSRLLKDLPSFTEEARHRPGFVPLVGVDDTYNCVDTTDIVNITPPSTTFQRPNDEILNILTRFKRLMKNLTTHVVDLDMADTAAVFEKQFHDQKRQRQRDFRNNKNSNSNEKSHKSIQNKTPDQRSSIESTDCEVTVNLNNCDTVQDSFDRNGVSDGKSKKRDRTLKGSNVSSNKSTNDKVLRRKRYHNFTPSAMAHEYLTYRRMDRFYHRATYRLDKDKDEYHRPYFALSLSGDMFLTGQVCRVVGLFIAIARGLIDDDFVDCVFDESYPHLVPTPPLPSFAQYASDVYYISIEGKVKAILTPRRIDRYENGWNDDKTVQSVRDWQETIRRNVALSWKKLGNHSNGSLLAEQQWTEGVLEPWVIRAKQQLHDYRHWKQNQTALGEEKGSSISSIIQVKEDSVVENPTPIIDISTVDPTVPPLYEKVLFYLRQANEGGLWPSTTPKRQLVMISNVTNDDKNEKTSKLSSTSLSMAHSKAKNNKIVKSSAYVYVEGEGGASGSFSLGAMPGDKCIQPKGNSLFPELMKAAFELEVALCPNRPPSSTIAVNRNAQFRPHTDSGAGSGQSTSLIVGLGTYTGGELMVEGKMIDIRYNPIEFDGWKQRHWTMPFHGERYSLVWFTPKGCEGINFVNR